MDHGGKDVVADDTGAGQTWATIESLRAFGIEALTWAGIAPEGAAAITEVQLESNLRGQATHHVADIPNYARRAKAGQMNGHPSFAFTRESATHALLDADNAPGQWAGVVAMRKAIDTARGAGVGIVGVNHSNHYGAAGHYAWMAADAGMIGFSTTNGGVVIAPWGGTTPTLGNDPLGVGIPAGQHLPIVLDIAMSVVAVGKIGLALAEGKPIPLGWALDKNGHPTVDPREAMNGSGLPIAGHKGYGLALVMEVLAGVLTNAGFGLDHDREMYRSGEHEHQIGHFLCAINPELFMPLADFTSRVDRLIDDLKASKTIEGISEILIPGEMEMRARRDHLAAGSVPLQETALRRLRDFRVEAGLTADVQLV